MTSIVIIMKHIGHYKKHKSKYILFYLYRIYSEIGVHSWLKIKKNC
jgi:hypothetical protein